LTEEDLNRLDRYIIEKNKLHNRYLHGWGVVCGLEVTCHPCQGYVTVRSGYALSPCGDDIAVCQDEAVNVCELIKECRDEVERQWDCDSAWPRPDPICGDKDEDWVLYICYNEKPSRGVTPLRGGGAVCCSRCGDSSNCGCGCSEKTHGHGNGNGNGCKTSKPRTTPQCEPTITCEGYDFRLRKETRLRERDAGALAGRLKRSFSDLSVLQRSVNALDANRGSNEILAIRAGLLDFLESHSTYSCDLHERILKIEVPPPGAKASKAFVLAARASLGSLVREVLRESICSALLPPCPSQVEENCVPIATLTLNCNNGCRVVRICNWEGRRIALGFPTIEYWFEALLGHSSLTTALDNLCCGTREVNSKLIVGDPLSALLAEAVNAEGKVKSRSVYKWLNTVLKGLIAKLT